MCKVYDPIYEMKYCNVQIGGQIGQQPQNVVSELFNAPNVPYAYVTPKGVACIRSQRFSVWRA